jgi:hypothetical protein
VEKQRGHDAWFQQVLPIATGVAQLFKSEVGVDHLDYYMNPPCKVHILRSVRCARPFTDHIVHICPLQRESSLKALYQAANKTRIRLVNLTHT